MGVNDTIVQGFLDVLNEFIKADPEAAKSLMIHRVPCNTKVADHLDITVSGDNNYTVGPLGLINGLLHRLTGQFVCVCFDNDRIIEFQRACPIFERDVAVFQPKEIAI